MHRRGIRLHRVVVLDRDIVFATVTHRGRREGLGGIAARLCRDALQGESVVAGAMHIGTCGSSSYSTRTSDAAKRAISGSSATHKRNGLAAEQDPIIV